MTELAADDSFERRSTVEQRTRGRQVNGDAQTWLTTKQLAHYGQVSVKLVAREVKAGRLRAAVIGGRRERRFRKAWWDEYMERCATPVEIQK